MMPGDFIEKIDERLGVEFVVGTEGRERIGEAGEREGGENQSARPGHGPQG